MTFKLSDIIEITPSGGRIVSMCSHMTEESLIAAWEKWKQDNPGKNITLGSGRTSSELQEKAMRLLDDAAMRTWSALNEKK